MSHSWEWRVHSFQDSLNDSHSLNHLPNEKEAHCRSISGGMKGSPRIEHNVSIFLGFFYQSLQLSVSNQSIIHFHLPITVGHIDRVWARWIETAQAVSTIRLVSRISSASTHFDPDSLSTSLRSFCPSVSHQLIACCPNIFSALTYWSRHFLTSHRLVACCDPTYVAHRLHCPVWPHMCQ